MALELLAAYRVGPKTLRLLCTYWDQLTMVAKAGCYLVHLERLYKVTAGLGHHGQLVPVRPKKSKRLGTNPVRRDKFQGHLPV